MEFRDAKLSDLSDVIAIYNSTISGRMVTADTEPVTVESRIDWFRKHTPGERPLWIVEVEAKTVGWVAVHSFYGRAAYHATAEISIYLHEDHRGRGLGKKVLARAVEACKDIGVKTLLGYIFAHNEPSLRLFKNFGFEEWGNLPGIAVLDGVERSLKILGMRIKE